MKLKQITAEQLAKQTSNFLDQVRRSPLLVRQGGATTLVIRPISDDDLADELILKNSRFRALIRRGRQNRRVGKGVSLAKVRAMF